MPCVPRRIKESLPAEYMNLEGINQGGNPKDVNSSLATRHNARK
jgi:hypothetical protein